jgi:hypothetical protein
MISLLIHMLLNPWSLGALAAIVVVTVALYFLIGPVKLLKLALDLRTWAVIGGVLAVIAYAHLEKQNADLTTKVENAQQQTVASDDGQKTTQLRVDQQAKRAGQSQRLHAVITKPRPKTDVGDAEDAVMDQIARERGQHVPDAPPVQTAPMPSPQPETKHVVQPVPVAPVVAQRVPDRAVVPAPRGLRKRPDVTVVP